MSRESSLWVWLKKARYHFRENLDLSRLENLVGAGQPDVEGYLKGKGQLWIELKAADRPKRSTTNVDLKHTRPSQVEWHNKRARLGGISFLLIQVGSGHEARRYLVPGYLVDFIASGVTEGWLMERSVCDPMARAEKIIEACFEANPF